MVRNHKKVLGTRNYANYDDFQGGKYPGRIVSISEEGPSIDCMEKLGKAWRWPVRKDCVEYDWDEVIRKIQPPVLRKRNLFRVPELDDFC